MYKNGNTHMKNRIGKIVSPFVAALMLAGIFASSTALAGKKPGGGGGGGGTTTTNPPTPTNFRVTAKTAYSISVAWDAAPATSGDFNYHLSGTHATAVILPKTATSHTFTRLGPGNEYWLFLYAKDAAGNVSGQANLGPVRTLLDTTAPWTAPVVTVGEVGSTYANLSWTRAQDDGPYHYAYEVWLNGSLSYWSNFPRDTIATVLRSLQPDTTYIVQIRTIDYGGHPSPLSSPVSFTTLPVNPDDTTAPTIPGNLWGNSDGSSEIWVTWTQSTDDFDAQVNIRYDVYVNGVLQDYQFGTGGQSIVFGQPGDNLIEVFATDTAGNTSAPATITMFVY
jgi:chitodextrinase